MSKRRKKPRKLSAMKRATAIAEKLAKIDVRVARHDVAGRLLREKRAKYIAALDALSGERKGTR